MKVCSNIVFAENGDYIKLGPPPNNKPEFQIWDNHFEINFVNKPFTVVFTLLDYVLPTITNFWLVLLSSWFFYVLYLFNAEAITALHKSL